MDAVGMYGTPQPVRPQAVLNALAPSSEAALMLPVRPGIDVAVRVLWELDGEQWLDGIAVRWWRRHVYVELDDRRIRTTGVWLDAGDVHRR